MAGIIWAMIYPACFPADVRVTIEVDDKTALKLTVGEYRSKENEALARALNLLYEEFCRRGGNVCKHVRAHRGRPWNEMADCIAKRMSKHPPPDPPGELVQLLCYERG
eukprot:508043-Pyramimonas_sp.AAC.1